MIKIKYSCGCVYVHWGESDSYMSDCCANHSAILVNDRLKEMMKND